MWKCKQEWILIIVILFLLLLQFVILCDVSRVTIIYLGVRIGLIYYGVHLARILVAYVLYKISEGLLYTDMSIACFLLFTC